MSHRPSTANPPLPPGFGVAVQTADFSVDALQRQLSLSASGCGAIATFTGYVRGQTPGDNGAAVSQLEIEHYPGMTERSLSDIVRRAAARWPLLAVNVVHRVGRLDVGEQIVWVGTASHHREAAFAATEFLMDYLKTEAPFWKKEVGSQGECWVEAKQADRERAGRWSTPAGRP